MATAKKTTTPAETPEPIEITVDSDIAALNATKTFEQADGTLTNDQGDLIDISGDADLTPPAIPASEFEPRDLPLGFGIHPYGPEALKHHDNRLAEATLKGTATYADHLLRDLTAVLSTDVLTDARDALHTLADTAYEAADRIALTLHALKAEAATAETDEATEPTA